MQYTIQTKLLSEINQKKELENFKIGDIQTEKLLRLSSFGKPF